MSLQSLDLCHFSASAQTACTHAHPAGTPPAAQKAGTAVFHILLTVHLKQAIHPVS